MSTPPPNLSPWYAMRPDVDARETADEYLRQADSEVKESSASLLRAQCD